MYRQNYYDDETYNKFVVGNMWVRYCEEDHEENPWDWCEHVEWRELESFDYEIENHHEKPEEI